MSLASEVNGKFSPVIVLVRQRHYVPEGISVRGWITDMLYTANCESKEALEAARLDPLVQSVEISR